VAHENRVYVTLGYQEPVSVLDAKTGKTLDAYNVSKGASEFVLAEDRLYIVAGIKDSSRYANSLEKGRASPPVRNKRIVAINTAKGNVIWEKDDSATATCLPSTLCVGDDKVFFQNTGHIVSLDASSGKTLWKNARLSVLERKSWSAPTLVVEDTILLSADRRSRVERPKSGDTVQWEVTSRPPRGEEYKGRLKAYSTRSGDELWQCPTAMNYTAPPDIFVVNGVVWTGTDPGRNHPDYQKGRDLETGEVVKTLNTKPAFTATHHHRCYRDKATQRFILMGRTGVEYIPFEKNEKPIRHCWIRGECQYGLMPANGLLYCPPHPCACYIQSNLKGFWALSSRKETYHKQDQPPRLKKGPAYGEVSNSAGGGYQDEWPVYRKDQERSSYLPTKLSLELVKKWQTSIGSDLTGLVISEGKLLVASENEHTIWALDAESGKKLWEYTAGGRFDSPPAIYKGKAIAGSADGYVYCLRLRDGKLVWKFRAAPLDLRTVSYGQVESVWPVTSSVLINNDRVYCTAGRSSYLDGGMVLYQLDPSTGEMLHKKRLYSRDPESGRQPEQKIEDVELPGFKPDVLVADSNWIYLRDRRMDEKGNVKAPDVKHLYSPVGLLDDHWWHRSYWQWGERTWGRYSGWHVVDAYRPSGRILAMNEKNVYGFGRKRVGPRGYRFKMGNRHLFCASKEVKPVDTIPAVIRKNNNLALRNHQKPADVRYHWSVSTSILVRAMVLTNNTLFVSGPVKTGNKDPLFDDPSWPSHLAAFSTDNGKNLAKYKLPSQPVFDGMAAANGRLYISTIKGNVICLGKEDL
jgi:outer membrane protein assembly factor BamB